MNLETFFKNLEQYFLRKLSLVRVKSTLTSFTSLALAILARFHDFHKIHLDGKYFSSCTLSETVFKSCTRKQYPVNQRGWRCEGRSISDCFRNLHLTGKHFWYLHFTGKHFTNFTRAENSQQSLHHCYLQTVSRGFAQTHLNALPAAILPDAFLNFGWIFST